MASEYDNKIKELQEHLPALDKILHDARNRKDKLDCSKLEKLRGIVLKKIPVSMEILKKSEFAIKRIIKDKQKHKKTVAAPIIPKCAVDRSSAPGIQASRSDPISDIKIKIETKSPDDDDDDDVQIVKSSDADAIIVLDSDESDDDENRKNTSPSSNAEISKEASKILSTKNAIECHSKEIVKVKKEEVDVATNSSTDRLRGNEGEPKSITERTEAAINPAEGCQSEPLIAPQTTFDSSKDVVSSNVLKEQVEPTSIAKTTEVISSAKGCQSDPVTVSAPPQVTFDPSKVVESRGILKELESQLKQLNSGNQFPMSLNDTREDVDMELLLSPLKSLLVNTSKTEEINIQEIESKCDDNMEPAESSITLPFPLPNFSNKSSEDLINEETSTQSGEVVKAKIATDEVIKSTCSSEAKNTNVPAATSKVPDQVIESSVENESSNKSTSCTSTSSHVPIGSQELDLTTKANNRLAEIIASLQKNLVSDTEEKEQEVAKKPENLFVNKIQLTELPSIVQDMLTTNEPTDPEDEEFKLVIDESESVVEAVTDRALPSDIDEMTGLDAERNKDVFLPFSSTSQIPADVLDSDDSLDREINEAIAELSGKNFSELNSAATMDDIELDDELSCDIKVPEISSKCDSESKQSVSVCNESKNADVDDSQVTKLIDEIEEKERENSVAMQTTSANMPAAGSNETENVDQLNEKTPELQDVTENANSSLEQLSKIEKYFKSNTIPSINKISDEMPCAQLNVEQRDNMLNISHESLLDELHLRIEESDEEETDAFYSGTTITNESEKISSSSEQPTQPPTSVNVSSKQTTTENIQADDSTTSECIEGRQAVESAEKESEKTDLVKVDNCAELTLKANNLLQDCKIPHTNVTTTADSSSNETQAAGAESVIEGSETEPPISRRAVESAEKESEKTDLVKVDNRAELTLKANNLLQDCNIPHTNVTTTADSSSNETRAAGAESLIEGSETEPPISRRAVESAEKESEKTDLVKVDNRAELTLKANNLLQDTNVMTTADSSSNETRAAGAESVIEGSETEPPISRPSGSKVEEISSATLLLSAQSTPNKMKEPQVKADPVKLPNETQSSSSKVAENGSVEIRSETQLTATMSPSVSKSPEPEIAPSNSLKVNISGAPVNTDAKNDIYPRKEKPNQTEMTKNHENAEPSTSKEPNITTETTKVMNAVHRDDLEFLMLQKRKIELERELILLKSNKKDQIPSDKLNSEVPDNLSDISADSDCVSLSFSDLSDVEPGEIIERPHMPKPLVKEEPNNFAFQESLKVTILNRNNPFDLRHQLIAKSQRECRLHDTTLSLPVPADISKCKKRKERRRRKHGFVVDEFDPSVNVKAELPIVPAHSKYVYRRSTSTDCSAKRFISLDVKAEFPAGSSTDMRHNFEHNNEKLPGFDKVGQGYAQQAVKREVAHQSSRSPEQYPEHNRSASGSLVSSPSSRPFDGKIRRSRSPNPFKEASTSQRLMSSRSPERHPEFNRPPLGSLVSPSSIRPFGAKIRRSRSPNPFREVSTAQKEYEKPLFRRSCSPKPSGEASTSQREHQKPPIGLSRSPKMFPEASTSQRELQKPPEPRSRSSRRRSRSPRRHSRSPLHLMKITKREPDRRSRSPRRSPVEIMKITKRSPDRPSRSPRRSPVHLMKITKRSPGRRSRSPRRSPVRLMKISKRSPDRRSRSPRRSPVRLMKISKRSPDRPSRSPKRRSISPKLRRLSRSPKRSPKNLRRSLSPPRVRRSSRSPRRSPRRLSPRRRSQSPRRCVARSPRRSPRRLSRSPKRSPRRLSRSPRRSPRRLSKSPRRSPRRLSRSPRRSSRSPRRSPRRLSRSPRRSPRRLSRSPRRSPRRLSRSPGHSRSSRSPRRSSRRLSRSPRRSPRRLSRSPKRSPRRLSRSPRRRSRSPRRSPRRLSRSPRRSPSWLPRSPRRSRSPRGSSRRHSSRSPRRLSRSPKRSPRSRSPRRSPSQSSSYIGRALSRSPVRIENLKPSLSDRSSQSPIRFVNVTNADEQILAKNKDPLRPNTSANKTVIDTIRCSENLQAPAAASVVSTSQPIAIIDLSDSEEEVTPANSNDSSANNNNANLCDTLTIEVSDDEESILEPPPPPKISAEDIQLSPTNNVNDNDGQVICLDDDEPLQKSSNKDTACVKVVEPQFSDNSNDSNGAQQGPSTSAELLEEKDLRELNDIKEELEQRLGIDAEVISQLVKSALNKANANDSASATTAPERQTQSGMTLILSTERLQAPVMAHVSPKDPRLNRLQPPKPIPAPSTEPPPPPMIPRLTPAVALPQSSPTRKSAVSSDEYSDNDDFSTESGSSSDEFTKSLKPNAEFITLEVSKLQEIIDEQIKKYLAQNKEQHEAVLKKTPTSKSGTKDSGAVRESSKSRPLRNACSKDGSGPRHMTAEKIVSDIKKSMASLCGTPTPSTSTSAPSETPRRKRGRPRKKTAVLSSSESDAENIPVPSPPSLSDKETAINLSGGTDKTLSDRSETPLPRRGRGGSRRRNLVVSSSESDAENVVTPSSKTLASKESADSLRLRITEDLTDIIKLGKSAKVKPSPALKRAEQTNLLTPLKEVPYNDKRQKSTEAHQSKKQKRVPKNIDTSMNCKSDATNCLLCKDKSKGLELISHYVNDHRENEVFTARLVTEQIKALKARPNYMHLSKNSSNIEKYTGKCPICDEAMTCTIGRFMEHLASHTGEFAYECDCCGIRDSRKRDLLKHCNKECEKGAKFIYVYRYDLSNKVIEAFVCGICNYIQLNRANVIKHLRTEHETQLLSSEDFVTVTLFQVGDEPSNEAVSEPVPDNIEVVDEAFAYDEDDTDNFEDIPGSPMGDAAGQGDDVVECVKNEFLQDVIDDFDWKAICDTLEDPDENLYEALKPEVTVEEVQANKDEKPTPDIGTQIFTEVHSMSLNGPGIEKDNRGATGQATTSDDINLSAANSSSNSQPSKKQKKSNQIKDTSKLLKVENIGVEEVSSDSLKFHCLTKNCNVEPFENLDDLRKHLKKHRSNWSGFCFACKKQVIPRLRQLDKELAHFIEKHLPKKSLTAEVLCPWIANDPRQCQKTEDVCKMLLTNFALENLYKCMGPDCVYTINSAKEMESHLAMNHANDPTALNCSYCKDSFPHRNALVDHIGQVHGSSNYQCSQCFYRSCAAYNVQMHQRTFHKNQEDVSVIVCAGQSHTFTTDILEILEYRLKNVQPIKCPFFSACRKNMYAKHLVLDHIRRDHSQKEAVDIASKTYDCMYCSYGADDLLSIRQHMANEHPDRLLYVCGRVFMKSLHLMIGQDDFDIASIKKTTCLVYIGGSVSKNRLRLTEEVTYASDSIQAVNMGEDPGALNARIRKWFGEAATHFEEVETYLQRIAAGASPDTMNNDEELELNELVMAVIKNTGFVGKQLYRCGFPMCTHSCENFDKFDRHLNGHRGDKKEPIYRCPHCNVIVATNQIRLHTLKHRRHRYLCYFCGESSESQNIAIDHLKSEHQSQGIVFVYITSDKESSPGGAEMESRIFVSKPRKISNDDDVAEVMRVVLKKRLDASGSSLAPKDVSKQERPESPVDRKEETTIPVFVSLDTRLTCNMDDCPFVAKTEPNLLMHIAERHRVMQKGKYECPHCSYVMPPTLRLNINRICNHLKYHGRNIVLCNVCNYYHHNRLRVLEHMSMCHPFNFATCTVHTRSTDGTKTKLEILYNKNVRSPDDSYKCTLCDATLTECDDFFIHMKELHLLNVRFVCDTCNFFENTLQAVEIHAKQKHPEGGKVRVRSVFLPAGGKWVQNLSPFTLLVESGGPAPDQSEDGPTSSRGISPQPSSSSKQNEQICNNKRKFEDADTAGSKKDSKKSRISGGSKRPADEKQSDENTKRARLSPVIDHEKSDVSSSQLKPNEEGSKSSDKSATPLAAPSATPSAHVEPATGIQDEVKPKPFLKLVPVEKLLRSDIQNGVVQNNHQIPPLQAQQWHEQPRDQLPTSDHQQSAPQTPNQLVEYPKVDVFLICFYCNARTNNFTTLHSHCREKHGGDSVHFTVSRRLLCAYCPMMLPYNDMKIHHMQYHPNHAFGTRSAALHFICGECPTVFKNKHEIEDHFKIAHSNLHLQKTPSFAYLTQPFLDDLLKIENNSGVEVNKCPCCDRIYLQYEPCQTHIEQTHSEAFGQTPNCNAYNNLLYGCYKCRVLFETETRAIHHMRKHVSPYGCKYCEMTFEVHNALVDHHRLFHKTVETTYRIQKNAETEEKFMSMLVRFPNGLILTRLQLENTDYGQREQYMQMIESREKAELQEWISRQERSQQIESIARIKIEIEQEASLFQSPSAGDDDTL